MPYSNFQKFFFILSIFFWQSNVLSLPIGFGKNQIDADYDQLKSKNFHIYHDHRTPEEAQMIRNSLEAAKPVMEKWFGIKRERPLRVISSAISSNASFANFITDVLEIQTLGSGYRDLFWHEYTHENMYLYFNNWFGPTGSIIHLATLPLWFIEGLADALSMSDGSDEAYSIERMYALTGKWPSYDRLHNLYTPSFSYEGYALSSTFVSWILRKYGADKLPKLLVDFKDYSMPWFWPWAAVPFNGFLPLDAALENMTGLRGPNLYELYKKEASEFHLSNAKYQNLFSKNKEKDVYNSLGSSQFFATKSGIYRFYKDKKDDILTQYKLLPNKRKFNIREIKQKFTLPPKVSNPTHIKLESGVYYVKDNLEIKSGIKSQEIHWQPNSNRESQTIYQSEGYIEHLSNDKNKLVWFEQTQSESKLCQLDLNSKKSDCVLSKKLPESLSYLGTKYLGSKNESNQTEEIWFSNTIQKLQGHQYEIIVWNINSNTFRTMPFKHGAPIKAAFTVKDNWLLVSESYRRSLITVDSQMNCLSVSRFNDFVINISGFNNTLAFAVKQPWGTMNQFRAENSIKKSSCNLQTDHKSPLVYAMNQSEIPLLSTTLSQVSPWTQEGQLPLKRNSQDLGKLDSGNLPFDKDQLKKSDSSEYEWASRPIFVFPYIGANDPISYQYGFISLPIMDYLQNETVSASFLYGLESNYPNTEVTLTSTRYWPTLEFSIYRQQSWDGAFTNRADGLRYSTYLDEKGVRINSNFKFHFYKTTYTLGLGSRFAHLKPYIGPFKAREGRLNEPQISLSVFKSFGDFSLNSSLNSRFTTEELNENFDYNQLAFYSNLSWFTGLFSSTLSTGVDFSRTRGKKTRLLQEIYTPLRTFIPGSGGGYNQNSFHLIGNGNLFSSIYGNNQVRGKANWTVPLNRDIDKLIGIVYIERLDFTAFFNRGGAWYGTWEPQLTNIVSAHGYNLDLQFKIQSINFNAGVGVGQVLKSDFEAYASFGFDALF